MNADVSLVITTYNWKEALELVLLSAFRQTVPPLEIVVADDGSGPDTAEMVRRLAAHSPVRLIHSWQPDKGFRLAKSRNRALARASGDYVILVDGDVVLDAHFVEDHLSFARPGYFVQGSRVLLDKAFSTRVLQEKRLDIAWCQRGVENRKNCFRLPWLARLAAVPNRRLRGIKTCNFAFWREDALRINGFNEEFQGWGREDSEFTVRLFNLGRKRRNLRFAGLVYHLHHPIRDRSHLPANDAILAQTIRSRLVRCRLGMDQYL